MKDETRKEKIKKDMEEGNKVKDFFAKIYMIITGASLDVKKNDPKKKSN